MQKYQLKNKPAEIALAMRWARIQEISGEDLRKLQYTESKRGRLYDNYEISRSFNLAESPWVRNIKDIIKLEMLEEFWNVFYDPFIRHIQKRFAEEILDDDKLLKQRNLPRNLRIPVISYCLAFVDKKSLDVVHDFDSQIHESVVKLRTHQESETRKEADEVFGGRKSSREYKDGGRF